MQARGAVLNPRLKHHLNEETFWGKSHLDNQWDYNHIRCKHYHTFTTSALFHG